jgi:hypothetical protein
MKASMVWSFVRVTVVLLGVAAAAASATAPAKHNVQRATTVPVGFEAAWSALIDLFADRSWPIGNLDKASGLVVTDWMDLGDQRDVYADCGAAGAATVRSTQVRFNVRVKPVGETTELVVNATFRQVRTGLEGGPFNVDCTSRGAVELMIHEQIAARGASANAPAPQKGPVAGQPSAPRGFYCSSSVASPAAGFCVRDKADCQRARDAASAAVADLDECRLVEKAWCFTAAGAERCAPGMATCNDRRQSSANVTAACTER